MDEELAHLAKVDCSVWACEPKLPIGWWFIKSPRLYWMKHGRTTFWKKPETTLPVLPRIYSCRFFSKILLLSIPLCIAVEYCNNCYRELSRQLLDFFPCPVRDPCAKSQQFPINGKWARSWPNRRSPWSQLWCVSCYDMLEEYDYEQSTCSHDDLTV